MLHAASRAVRRWSSPSSSSSRHSPFERRSCHGLTLPKHCTYLRNSLNGGEIFLLGTCHSSSDSAKEVKEIIRTIRPSAIALELCPARAQQLRSRGQCQTLSPTDMFNFPALGQKAFAYTADSLRDLLEFFGFTYGQEFKVSMEEGEKLGVPIHYIDQDADVTFRKIRSSLSFHDIAGFITAFPQLEKAYPVLFEAITTGYSKESVSALLRDRKCLNEMFQICETHFPGPVKALVHDRNQLMVQRLQKMEGRVIAVVGLGHLGGMKKMWQEAEL